MSLSREEVLALFDYNPETGVMTWRSRPDMPAKWNTRYAGGRAGVADKHTTRITLGKSKYCAHRIIWLYMTGEWPTSLVDHKNLNPNDNRWANLRLATKSQNNANGRLQRNNTSGLKGVSLVKKTGKWQASLSHNGKQKGLGYFDCRAAAYCAYLVASSRAFGEFARAA